MQNSQKQYNVLKFWIKNKIYLKCFSTPYKLIWMSLRINHFCKNKFLNKRKYWWWRIYEWSSQSKTNRNDNIDSMEKIDGTANEITLRMDCPLTCHSREAKSEARHKWIYKQILAIKTLGNDLKLCQNP